jgi:hypothetical protein
LTVKLEERAVVASDPNASLAAAAAWGSMMRRVVTWGPVAGTIAAGAVLIGAEPVAPRAFPPLPVPPVERQAMPPFFARITISGDAKMSGVFESCTDPAATIRTAQARAKAGPADAPSPVAGCSHTSEVRTDGSVHIEMRCDRAKGARASFHMTADGTANDLRNHTETYAFDSVTGEPKTTVHDSHMVRLGPCPADLKPGQVRRPGGPVIDKGEAARLLEGARGAPP